MICTKFGNADLTNSVFQINLFNVRFGYKQIKKVNRLIFMPLISKLSAQ